jgi:hypothetical protein
MSTKRTFAQVASLLCNASSVTVTKLQHNIAKMLKLFHLVASRRTLWMTQWTLRLTLCLLVFGFRESLWVPETSSGNLPRTPCKIPKTKNQYSFDGESSKSRTLCLFTTKYSRNAPDGSEKRVVSTFLADVTLMFVFREHGYFHSMFDLLLMGVK